MAELFIGFARMRGSVTAQSHSKCVRYAKRSFHFKKRNLSGQFLFKIREPITYHSSYLSRSSVYPTKFRVIIQVKVFLTTKKPSKTPKSKIIDSILIKSKLSVDTLLKVQFHVVNRQSRFVKIRSNQIN